MAGVNAATAPNAAQSASPFFEPALARRETRLELDIDEATQRVVGRFVDAETGEVVRQVPPEEVIRLLARARELLGAILDETA